MWWPFSTTCQSKARLDGKTVVITGANTGIRKETARDLYRRGARVLIACRDVAKDNAAAEDLKSVPTSQPDREQFVGEPGEIVVCKLNLSSLASVRECAKKISATESAVHIVINNAGIAICPKSLTVDGFEMHFGTNHLGYFLFTLLLLPTIIQSRKNYEPCRIVNVSSVVHKIGDIDFDDLMSETSYSPLYAYARSKLAVELFIRELARRLKGKSDQNNNWRTTLCNDATFFYRNNGFPTIYVIFYRSKITAVNTYSLHPGAVNTEWTRHLDDSVFRGVSFFVRIWKFLMKTAEQGAQTTLHCAVDEESGKQKGLYYKECKVCTASRRARDAAMATRLWDESIKLVGLPTNNLPQLIEQIPK